MKPATKRLKDALAEVGIPRTDSRVNTSTATGIVTGHLITDEARRTALDEADRITAAGYSLLVQAYRCGCPIRVWLCRSSSASVRETVTALTHDCPGGRALGPLTATQAAVEWLRGGVS
ncbi:hypothetical protein ACGFNU_20895 [Spirillospora sp. NPDC048911]|uniref:hypothetical protein n=1 Tax=Spirillospora sp. NPDC048911 TaxID=3364527 RepID=UPI003710D333